MQFYKGIEKFVKGKAVFVGIDIHDHRWAICFYCEGEVLERVRMRGNYPDLLRLLRNRYGEANCIRLVYEAGFSGFWLYRSLNRDGYDCIVTPPNRIPKTGQKIKTDKRDAETLARYLAVGILKQVTVPSTVAEAERRLIRRYKQLVKKQTRCKNQIRSFQHVHGLSKPDEIRCHWSRAYMQWLENLPFEEKSDIFLLHSMIQSYYHVRKELASVIRYLRKLAKSSKYMKNYKILTAVKGVGLITAMTFLLEIFDFTRFRNEKSFSSFLGLTPSQFSSGEHVRLGNISKEGNAHLRHVLVESAWTVIKHDPHLRDKYNRIRAKGTNGNQAIVAVARSLAIRLRACIVYQNEYHYAV